MLEQAGARDPPLAQHETVGAVAVKQALEMFDDGVVTGFLSFGANESGGERPIVIPAAAIFPNLNRFASDAFTSEVLDGLLDGLPIGFAHIHQHSIHVEDEKAH